MKKLCNNNRMMEMMKKTKQVEPNERVDERANERPNNS